MGGAAHKSSRVKLDDSALRRLAAAYAAGVSWADLRKRFGHSPADFERALAITNTPRREGGSFNMVATP